MESSIFLETIRNPSKSITVYIYNRASTAIRSSTISKQQNRILTVPLKVSYLSTYLQISIFHDNRYGANNSGQRARIRHTVNHRLGNFSSIIFKVLSLTILRILRLEKIIHV